MANRCYNTVVFTGELPGLLKARLLFDELHRYEETTGKIKMPEFIKTEQSNFMYDIGLGEDSVSFSSRWSPALEIIYLIAEEFQLDYKHSYHEMGMAIYGQAECTAGNYKDYRVRGVELQQISYDLEAEQYKFEGRAFDDDIEIFDILLQRKLGGSGDVADPGRSNGLKR